MSSTEIYKFNKSGIAVGVADVRNSWRGAMAVWRLIEKKYLPPLPKPEWMDVSDYEKNGYSRCSFSMTSPKHDPMKDIWDLFNDERISKVDKIVLGSTLDNVIVMKDNLLELIDAFEKFEGDTSLEEQALVFRGLLGDDDLIAVGWNQTSVNGDTWVNFNYNDETGECEPYNITIQNEHWNLFEYF